MIQKLLFILFLNILPLLILGLPVYLFLRYRNSNKAWDSIKQHFEFEETNPNILNGSWKGERFKISYSNPRRQRASITVSLECSLEDMPEGKLRAERWWDKLGKASGLNKEFQTRSEAFNKAVYVASDNKEFQNIIRDSSIRHAVAPLIESRFSEVDFFPPRSVPYSDNHHSGSIKWRTKAYHGFWKKLASPSYLKEIFSSLLDIKKRLEHKQSFGGPATNRTGQESNSPSALVSSIGNALPVGALVLGGLLFYWGTYYPTLSSQLQLIGLKAAGIIFLAYVPFGFLCFRGKNDSHITLLVVLGMALIGLPMFTIGILETTNGFLDSSPATWQDGEAVELQYDEGEYFATVTSAHNGVDGESELEISEEMYNQLQTKGKIMVKVKDGYLTEPWIKEIKLPNDY